MTQVLDAAYPAWSPATLKANGVPAVLRYLSWLPNSKVIQKAEYDAYLAAGIAVTLNWESTGRSYRDGYSKGFADGAEARRQARELGHPDNRPIIQSIDENLDPSLLPTALEYQRGFNDGGGCGPQGAYTTGYALDAMGDAGLISVGWQTNARGWYGNGPDSKHAALLQRTSKSHAAFPSNSYDENDIVSADWGQHPAPFVVPYVPPPKPKPPTPVKPVTGGTTVDLTKTQTNVIQLAPQGFGLFVGEWNTAKTVAACWVTLNGPAPSPFGPDDWWEWVIDSSVAAQMRGPNVIVTGFFPKWQKGDPQPQVHVFAIPA